MFFQKIRSHDKQIKRDADSFQMEVKLLRGFSAVGSLRHDHQQIQVVDCLGCRFDRRPKEDDTQWMDSRHHRLHQLLDFLLYVFHSNILTLAQRLF